MSTDRTIRKFSSHEEQQAETYRYWRSRSPGERLAAVWDATLAAWQAKGFQYDPFHRSERTLTRISRSDKGARYGPSGSRCEKIDG